MHLFSVGTRTAYPYGTTARSQLINEFCLKAFQLFAGGASPQQKADAFDAWLLEEIRTRWSELPLGCTVGTLQLAAQEQSDEAWAICVLDLIQARDAMVNALCSAEYDGGVALLPASEQLFAVFDRMTNRQEPRGYKFIPNQSDFEGLNGLEGKHYAAAWLELALARHPVKFEAFDCAEFIRKTVLSDTVAEIHPVKIADALIVWLSAGGTHKSFSSMYAKAITTASAPDILKRVREMVGIVQERTRGGLATTTTPILKSLASFRNCKGTPPAEELRELLDCWCADDKGEIVPRVLRHFAQLYHDAGRLPDPATIERTHGDPWGGCVPHPRSPLGIWSPLAQYAHPLAGPLGRR